MIKNNNLIRMKNKLKILALLAIGVFLLPTCQKEPNLRMPELSNGVIPLIEKDASKDQNISSTDLAGFIGTIKVGLYYKDKPKSMNLMVCMNDDHANTGIVKANITSFPTAVDISVASLVDILPGLDSINQLLPGDYFMFYVDVTLENGKIVNGNDTLYDAYNSSIVNLPGSSLNVKYSVLCPLDLPLTHGDYHSVSADWNSEGDITITPDLVDPYTVYVAGLYTIEGGNEDLGPLVMHIDPVTSEVIADKTVIASDYFGDANGAFEGTGTYNNCDGSYQMKFEITVDAGSYGVYNFTFTRN
jgi:hypothetical protein